MDLTKKYPRSPREKMLGIVSLARAIDKARAFNEGKLGEYDYDCPHDRALFDFLGTNGQEFAAKVRELNSDALIGQWIAQAFLSKKSREQVERFNQNAFSGTPSRASTATTISYRCATRSHPDAMMS
jgi:hypothetical protein